MNVKVLDAKLDAKLAMLPTIFFFTFLEGLILVLLDKFVTPKAITIKRDQFANNLLSIPLALLLFTAALSACITLIDSHESRWMGVTWSSTFFQTVYVSHNIVNTIIDLREHRPFHQKIPMLLHHLTSILAYGGGLTTGRMHFWACLDGLCEFTNINLCVLLLCNTKEGGAGDAIKRTIGDSLSLLNGLLLWIGFLVFRMILFPMWLYWFWLDAKAMYYRSPESESHPLVPGGERFSWIELGCYPVITMFLFLLSLLWFVQITKGALKQLGFFKREETVAEGKEMDKKK